MSSAEVFTQNAKRLKSVPYIYTYITLLSGNVSNTLKSRTGESTLLIYVTNLSTACKSF